MHFSNRIKQLRIEKGMTQKDVAHIIGVSRPTITGYETKGKQPDYETLTTLASFFNVTTDYLLGRTDIKNQDKISEAINNVSELLEFYEEMKERENLKLLLKQTRMMDENGIRQILRIIKAIQDEEDANG